MSIIEPAQKGGAVVYTAPAEYETIMRNHLAAWDLLKTPPPLEDVVALISLGQPFNAEIGRWLKARKYDMGEFKALMWNMSISEYLGAVPSTPADFIRLLADRLVLIIDARGRIASERRGHWDHRSKATGEVRRYWLDESTDWGQREARHFFKKPWSLDRFRLEARATAANLKLPYSAAVIDDAVAVWFDLAREERRFDVINQIAFQCLPREVSEMEASLVDLCRAAFDTSQHPAEFVAAAIRKFIWQVKRKLDGIPVTNHAMLVLTGIQGNGKSTFIGLMIAPVACFSAPADFDEAGDNRNVDLWDNRVLNFDEMSRAAKADIETVKNVITATHLTRRPMRTNRTEQIEQKATLIGSSNRDSLADLIRDNTGLRRFISIRFANEPDRAVINAFNWQKMWQAVDPRLADPMLPFADLLKARQEVDRERCNVEVWLEQFNPRKDLDGRLVESSRVKASVLYLAFREWEQDFFPASRSSETRFALDMKQLRAEGRCPFVKKRTGDHRYYVFDGDMNPGLTVVQGGREE